MAYPDALTLVVMPVSAPVTISPSSLAPIDSVAHHDCVTGVSNADRRLELGVAGAGTLCPVVVDDDLTSASR